MTQTGPILRRSAFPLLWVFLGLAVLRPDLAPATDLPLTGGPGGTPDRAECPKGSYLVGLAGRTGEWVDRIAPVCAPWLRGSPIFGIPTVGKFLATSGGGQEVRSELIGGIPGKVCRGRHSNNIIPIQYWHIDTLRSQNRFVQFIEAYCESLTAPADTGFLDFGPMSAATEERVAGIGNGRACHPSEAPVGIHGRFGLFVDALGLICGPLPASLGAPATKLPGRLVQVPPSAQPMSPQAKNMRIPADMYVITKPAAGDPVAQGQLIITAMLPTVGATNVAELELRYLDAPPKQRDSYPYLTTLSVMNDALRQGYAVDQRVTGYVGRWQVRARSAMKTPPGPWSVPVRFQMVKAQQPPPMVHMPKPSAPITQTPAPGTGAATQMVRPPTTSSGSAARSRMVRPRGVEEKAGEAPAEPGKKP